MISARLDRLPFSRWHARLLSMVGMAHLFDAFDALTIAFVLPVLIMQWGLSPAQAGLLISAGYLGQIVGSILFGMAAQRFGRIIALRFALLLLATFSFASALAWSFTILLIMRIVQGIGLGGETPVAAVYINEVCPAKLRGRMIFALQSLFAAGTVLAALAAMWIIPYFGWQAMFLIGGLPIILAALLPRLAPESPRWLAANGRLDEAGAIVLRVEQKCSRERQPLAEPQPNTQPPSLRLSSGAVGFRSMFADGFAVRTISLWIIAFCTSITGYGIIGWMPSLYRTVYKLPLDVSLKYGFATNVAGFVGVCSALLLIDVIGRRRLFMLSFGGAAVPLLYIWLNVDILSAFAVMILSTASMLFMSMLLSGIYVYGPELYPTRIRSVGAGTAMAWLRVGSLVGPIIVGFLLPRQGISGVFLLFGASALLGLITVILTGIETKGRKLEEIAV